MITGSELGKPLVSVIAVCYNHAKFVIECLESIRRQTLIDRQLIIVDDCSHDGSPSAIGRWIEQHGVECEFIVHRHNVGVCQTLNEAVGRATGKYVSIIATDDVWMPDKLERQVELMERLPPTVGVVYSDAFLIDQSGNRLPRTFLEAHLGRRVPPTGRLFRELLAGNFIPGMTTLIRRDCIEDIGPFDEGLVFEDYDFWLRMAYRFEFAASTYVSAMYRMLPDSLLHRFSARMSEDGLTIYSKWLGLSHEWDETIKRGMASCAWGLYKADHPERRRYVHLMLRYDAGLPSWGRFVISLGGWLRWSQLGPIRPIAAKAGLWHSAWRRRQKTRDDRSGSGFEDDAGRDDLFRYRERVSYYPRKKLKGPLARKVLGGENAKGRAQGGDGLGPAG